MEKRKEILHGKDLFADGMAIYVNRAEETFVLDFHVHDFIEITYVAEGKGFHHIGNDLRNVSKGDLFVLPIGTPHVFRPETAGGKHGLIVFNCIFTEKIMYEISNTVDELDLKSLLVKHENDASSYLTLHDEGFILEPIFQTMHREHAAKQKGSANMLFSLLTQLLILLTRKINAPSTIGFKKHEDVLEQAIHYIQRNAGESLTLAKLAQMCQMSERHFFRLFKHRTGQTYYTFVQHVRVQASCGMLLESKDKIAAIAIAVGYRDLASFNQVFQRITGMTPSAYRKSDS